MAKLIGYIYKATHKNNKKSYIGQTVSSLASRKSQHKCAASQIDINFFSKFYNAIKKYGFEIFEWDILETVCCKTKKDLINMLNEKEVYWINKYNSIENGYNTVPGGGNIYKDFTEEAKNRISKSSSLRNSGSGNPMFGKKHSIETRKKISKTKRNNGDSAGEKNSMYGIHRSGKENPMYGKNHTIESRKKMSETKKKNNYGQNIALRLRGEKNPNAKLTEENIKKIYWLLENSNLTQKEIGNIFNVGQGVISQIKTKKRWAHVRRDQ